MQPLFHPAQRGQEDTVTEDSPLALPEARTDTVDVAEAAGMAGVSERTMRRWLPKQPLWAVLEKHRWQIRREPFEAWLAERPDAAKGGRPASSAMTGALKAELEAVRSESDRLRSEVVSVRQEASRWQEEARAWREAHERAQATVETLSEAVTRLSLPAHEGPDEDRPDADTAGQVAEVGERRRSWLDWFFGR